MLIIGLTGSIGMGKSAAATIFRARGLPVCDADAAVHKLYRGAAIAPVEAAFPGSTTADGVDRQKLAAQLLADPSGFKRLEAIVHPLVRSVERDFLLAAERQGCWAAVLEIPLLFETGGDSHVDVTVVVFAPVEVQKARVMARPGMTEAKLAQILSRQWSNDRERTTASYVVDTSGTLEFTEQQIDVLLGELRSGRHAARALDRSWR